MIRMFHRFIFAGIIIAVLAAGIPAVTAQTVGGDQGWYVVHCNVDGASVYFDGDFKGTISNGELTVPVYTTGTPYQQYTVEKEGYSTFTDSIESVPAKGGQIDLYATLQQATSTPGTIGGDQGWYVVHCNVDGATVSFDGEVKGTISGGTLTVPVYTTGTPYQQYTVKKEGYQIFTAQINQYPSKGEQVDLYAAMNPVATTPAPSPLPVEIAILAAGIGAMAVMVTQRRR